MSLLATIATAAGVTAAEEHVVNELPFNHWLFGAIAFVAFTALAIVTFGFRDVANRHQAKAEQYAREHGGAESHH